MVNDLDVGQEEEKQEETEEDGERVRVGGGGGLFQATMLTRTQTMDFIDPDAA